MRRRKAEGRGGGAIRKDIGFQRIVVTTTSNPRRKPLSRVGWIVLNKAGLYPMPYLDLPRHADAGFFSRIDGALLFKEKYTTTLGTSRLAHYQSIYGW